MDGVIARRVAAVVAAANGLLHLFVALIDEPHEYIDEYPFIGVLFFIGSGILFVSSIWLWMAPSPIAWGLGTMVSVGMAVGLIMSRTTGLFGFKEGYWPWTAWLSFGLEAVFLLMWLGFVRQTGSVLGTSRAAAAQGS